MSTAVLMASDDVLEVLPAAFLNGEKDHHHTSKFHLWTSIQESKKAASPAVAEDVSPPYVHPLLRRSSSYLSQRSLEICTESLGSETGSDGFSDIDDNLFSASDNLDQTEVEEQLNWEEEKERLKKPLAAVSYHCSTNLSSPPKMFPPPLPSISRRDGPCVHMKRHHRDGRLVVHAVPVPSQNYLHCQREEGRLLLSFIETTFEEIYPEIEDPVVIKQKQVVEFLNNQKEEEEEEEEEEEQTGEEKDGGEEEVEEVEEEEEEEEEVEVVDRGIVVEVKVSSLPQLQNGGMKVHRSSLVINKFVGGTPALVYEPMIMPLPEPTKINHPHINTITPNVASASELNSTEVDCWGNGKQSKTSTAGHHDNKFLFTSKKMMNREALLHQVRRCSDYNRPLFFWEPWCIASAT